MGNAEVIEIKRQVEVLTHGFPSPQRTIVDGITYSSPMVVAGDWHPEAIEIAMKRASSDNVEQYIRKADAYRTYSPYEIRRETSSAIAQRSSLLTGLSIAVTKKFADIEMRNRDYVLQGLKTIYGDMSRTRLMLKWGTEESQHPLMLLNVLEDAGVIDPVERNSWEKRAYDVHWDISRHGDLGKIDYFYLAYATKQEYETEVNYRKLQKMVATDYFLKGHSEESAKNELRKMKTDGRDEVGFLKVLKLIRADEAAHRGLYTDVSMLHLRYIPGVILDALHRSQSGFEMPSKDLMPELNEAVLEALYKGSEWLAISTYVDNFNVINRRHGFKDRKALKKATQNSAALKEGKARFEIILPDGTFIPNLEAA